MKYKDLLGLKDLTAEEITEILDLAEEMKGRLVRGEKKSSDLAGKSVVTLFYENSTRTRTSFEAAAKFLGATCGSIAVAQSSVQKGETLIDTGYTLDALQTDAIVIRHSVAGAPKLLADHVKAHVINGGDGLNEHPTQALLDFFTMRERFGRSFEGMKVAIIGDVKHSRVARSNLWGLAKLGAKVALYAPETLMPEGIESMGGQIADTLEEALTDADVVMALRIQLERQKAGLFPSLSEYAKFYGLNEGNLKLAKTDAIVMHPGPINRGVELTTGVADCDQSKIREQVTNGVAVRMSVLSLLCGRS